MAKYEAKTRETAADVDAFLDGIPDETRRADAKQVRALMERVSGEPARLWGSNIIGFGRYHYRYDSGHEGDSARLAFSPRAKELVLYVMGQFPERRDLLDRLGKHREGKACVYVKRLADIDEAILETLIRASFDYMREAYPGGG